MMQPRSTIEGPASVLRKSLPEKIVSWLGEQRTLFEAFLVAVSLHVLLLPVLWFAGWVLPWPKSPIITTIIEFDLRNWPPKPKKVFDYRDPALNK